MTTLLGPLLAVGGVGAYFGAVMRWPLWRRVPWEFLAVGGAGALWSVGRLVAAPGLGTGLAMLVSVGVVGFFAWYVFSYSMFGPREDRPGVGERFADFDLPTSTGETFSLADARGKPLLLLFYRGAW